MLNFAAFKWEHYIFITLWNIDQQAGGNGNGKILSNYLQCKNKKKHQPNVSCFVRIRKCQPLTVILITRTPDAYITFVVFIVISNN